jgi:hypothetical protein
MQEEADGDLGGIGDEGDDQRQRSGRVAESERSLDCMTMSQTSSRSESEHKRTDAKCSMEDSQSFHVGGLYPCRPHSLRRVRAWWNVLTCHLVTEFLSVLSPSS